MDYQFAGASAVMLAVNIIYAVIAFMIGLMAFIAVDKWIFRKIDFEEEIKKGNLAAAVFGASHDLCSADHITGARPLIGLEHVGPPGWRGRSAAALHQDARRFAEASGDAVTIGKAQKCPLRVSFDTVLHSP